MYVLQSIDIKRKSKPKIDACTGRQLPSNLNRTNNVVARNKRKDDTNLHSLVVLYRFDSIQFNCRERENKRNNKNNHNLK